MYSFVQNRKLEGEQQNSADTDLLNKVVNLDLASRVEAVTGRNNFVWSHLVNKSALWPNGLKQLAPFRLQHVPCEKDSY